MEYILYCTVVPAVCGGMVATHSFEPRDIMVIFVHEEPPSSEYERMTSTTPLLSVTVAVTATLSVSIGSSGSRSKKSTVGPTESSVKTV